MILKIQGKLPGKISKKRNKGNNIFIERNKEIIKLTDIDFY